MEGFGGSGRREGLGKDAIGRGPQILGNALQRLQSLTKTLDPAESGCANSNGSHSLGSFKRNNARQESSSFSLRGIIRQAFESAWRNNRAFE